MAVNPAHAGLYAFSYSFLNSDVVSGTFIGTADAGNSNLVTATTLVSLAYNGTPYVFSGGGIEAPDLGGVGGFLYRPVISGDAVYSFDGTATNFGVSFAAAINDNNGDTDGLWIALSGPYAKFQDDSINVRDTDYSYDPDYSYQPASSTLTLEASASTVSEPAEAALIFTGLGLMGFTNLRRKTGRAVRDRFYRKSRQLPPVAA